MSSWTEYLRFQPDAFARLRNRRRRAGARAASPNLLDWGIDHRWRCEFERSLMGRRSDGI